MKARIYVRAARRPNWARGGRYKIAADHNRNDRPLTQGEETLRTLHFAVDVEIPDVLFEDPAMPVVKIEIQADGAFRDEPVVVQVPLDVATRGEEVAALDA